MTVSFQPEESYFHKFLNTSPVYKYSGSCFLTPSVSHVGCYFFEIFSRLTFTGIIQTSDSTLAKPSLSESLFFEENLSPSVPSLDDNFHLQSFDQNNSLMLLRDVASEGEE